MNFKFASCWGPQVWDRRALGRGARPAGVLPGHTEGITHLDARGDGRYLLSNAKDQTARLWDVRRVRLPKETLCSCGRSRQQLECARSKLAEHLEVKGSSKHTPCT